MLSIFAQNFRFLREEKGISQTEMGDELGFSRASVDAYEDDRAMPPYPKLKTIADYFNLAIEEITEEELWNSPLEKEIQRVQKENEDIEEKIGEELRLHLKSLNIEIEDEGDVNQEIRSEFRIPIIEKKFFDKYIKNSWPSISDSFKKIVFQMPEKKQYRAFEAGEDFPMNNSVLIGTQLKNLETIKDSERYLIVSERLGLLYRRVFNQIKSKGVLILSGEVAGIELSEIHSSEIKEIWKIEAFYSITLPEPNQNHTQALKLAQALTAELKRLNTKS
jgi:transcriptional regulator with XRE-family HTH domain